MKQFFTLLMLLLFSLTTQYIGSQVSISKADQLWNLYVGEHPFKIKGVTFGYEKDVNNYDQYFKDLQFLGVNTIRTWGTDKNTSALLDAAEAHGIRVMLGIWMRHGRPGMEDDDSFDYMSDFEGMEVMYQDALHTVESYKDHPALLTWGVGNEVYLNTATDEEKKAYSIFLEKVCSEIKKLDTIHPITSVEAWTFGIDWWKKYVPSIDIYGLNVYGNGLSLLADEMEHRGIDKPYIITEYNVTGEWDIHEEKHGVKREPIDQEKYDAIVDDYIQWIKNEPKCLGVYVFHYSTGENFISTWFFSHYNNLKRPTYWAIREAFTGHKPINNMPVIESLELPDYTIKSGTWVPVELQVSDSENEPLVVSFSYNQRTGSRIRRDQILPLKSRGNLKDGFEIQIPEENGGIKVYAMIGDSYGNMGIGSTTIMVQGENAAKRKYLVPKVKLPFYVYKDNQNLPYIPTGYMGNHSAMEVDLDYNGDVYEGSTAIRIRYKDKGDWYGVGFVNPANDWGDILGGYDLSGAKKFSFYAKANFDNISAAIGFGLIDDDKPYPDTANKSIDIKLSTKWKKYTINIKDEDMSCIRSGLVLFSSGRGFAHEIYIDNVVFE